MSRPKKITLIVLASLAGLVLLAVIAALVAVQTPWFRDYARKRIVAEIDKASGGRSEIGSLGLDIFRLRAEVRDFVLHGKERPGEPPVARVKNLKAGVKIISLSRREFAVDHVIVDEPRVFVRVDPDGSTNLPTPPPKEKSNKDPIQTVLDLAIGRFEINNGQVAFADRKIPLNVKGENLVARMAFDQVNRRYDGNIAMSPLLLQSKAAPLPVNVNLPFRISENRVELKDARLNMPQSHIELTAWVADLNATPRGQFQLFGTVIPAEVAASVAPAMVQDLRRSPPLRLHADADVQNNAAEIRTVHAQSGGNEFGASGRISDLKELNGALRFYGNVAVAELGRIFRVPSNPRGTVKLTGDAQLAGMKNYVVNARVEGRDIGMQAGKTALSNVQFSTNVRATPDLVAADAMRLAALGGTFDGRAALKNGQEYSLDGQLRGFDLKYLATTYGDQRRFAWDGTISGPVSARGNLKAKGTSGLTATADLGIAPGGNGIPLSGKLNVAFDGPRDTVNVGNSYVALPNTRLDLSGTIGTTMHIRLLSRNLNDFLPALAMTSDNPLKELPVALDKGGTARFDGTVQGSISDPLIDGRLAMDRFSVQQAKIDGFQADINARQNGASVRNLLLRQGAGSVTAEASVGLRKWKPEDDQPLSAKVDVRQARIGDLLKMAGKPDVQVDGILTVAGAVTGTVGKPNGGLDLTVRNGSAYGEPLNAVDVRVNYAPERIELARADIDAGEIRLNANGAFDHKPGNFKEGTVKFHLASNDIALARVKTVQSRRPGLSGIVKLAADGAATLQAQGNSQVLFNQLNASLTADDLALQDKRLGKLVATADTRGQDLVFKLRSDVAQSVIEANGTCTLTGDYPVNAKVSFAPVRLGPLRQALAPPATAGGNDMDGIIEGGITIAGPASRPESMKGELRLTKVEVSARNAAGEAGQPQTITIRNEGPFEVAMDAGQVRIRNAHFVGPSTDFALTGGATIKNGPVLDLEAKGNIGLGILHSYNEDILAGGDILIEASAKGPTAKPDIKGRLQLRNVAVNMIDVPNGLSNAHGAIVFNDKEAVVQDITGETGGGKITLAGFVRYGGVPEPEFRLNATAKEIRVRQKGGISVKTSAGLQLLGNKTASTLSGNVTIQEVAFYSHSDFGSMLSQAGTPPSAPAAKEGVLGGMRMDVRVDTAPDVQFITALAQNLEAEAHLRLRGSPSRPGMLGRVTVNQGELVFFGTKYTVSRGTVQFYDPQRIQPVLDIDLEAQAKGVQVILSVTGPMNALRFNYRSDPPMPFSDVVALLATGKVPTTDPVLAANQPVAPQQSFEQMGASTLLGQAVANPVAGRLQRLFGVSKLKIDPQISGAENTPQARVTMEQQISKELTFTYIQDITSSNPQVIRIEWAPDPVWSAVAVRDQNGFFGLDFFYKKRFR